jgi:hypothetical protein
VARGWESKSVESQIESANARHGHPRVHMTPEQMAVERKRDSLMLHRARVLQDLEKCSDDRYRKQLNDGLSYLDTQIAALTPPA